jgi:hypothetical protein
MAIALVVLQVTISRRVEPAVGGFNRILELVEVVERSSADDRVDVSVFRCPQCFLVFGDDVATERSLVVLEILLGIVENRQAESHAPTTLLIVQLLSLGAHEVDVGVGDVRDVENAVLIHQLVDFVVGLTVAPENIQKIRFLTYFPTFTGNFHSHHCAPRSTTFEAKGVV